MIHWKKLDDLECETRWKVLYLVCLATSSLRFILKVHQPVLKENEKSGTWMREKSKRSSEHVVNFFATSIVSGKLWVANQENNVLQGEEESVIEWNLKQVHGQKITV